jgi:NAD(P)H-hydrate epimerase
MSKHVSPDKKRILIVCGPGNNGGDGLVAARHLYHFGYQPTILYLRVGRDPFYLNLVTQCEALSIPILQDIPTLDSYDLIVDALFGFSFTGPVKAPYNDLIASFALTKVPIVSVDIPSGWNVDKGDVHNTNFIPQAVVSLTAPKLCMKGYQGQHYVGGR